jgi:hypothetical protein
MEAPKWTMRKLLAGVAYLTFAGCGTLLGIHDLGGDGGDDDAASFEDGQNPDNATTVDGTADSATPSDSSQADMTAADGLAPSESGTMDARPEAAESGMDAGADVKPDAGVDANADTGACNGPKVVCGGACLDVSSDDLHCGGCSACPLNHACESSTCIPFSCAAIIAANPAALDGSYTIDPDGHRSDPPVKVFCDMSVNGGGWTLLIALAPSTVTNGFTAPSSWPDTLPQTKAPPTVSGLYKGSLAAFHDVREEIASGTVVVFGSNKTPAELEVIRQLYGTQSRVAAAPLFSDIPACRESYTATTDSIVGCTTAGASSPNTPTLLGWADDPDSAHSSSCWFARGNCCSMLGGSSACDGDVTGTHWARTWFR